MNDPDFWQNKFPEMQPVDKPPSLATLNGIGTMAYGRRDFDEETNTYVTTLCFTLVFLPLFTLKAYRVADAAQGGWFFIGRVPLSGLARGWNFFVLACVILGGGGLLWMEHKRNSETIAAGHLAEGDHLAEAGQAGQAANTYRQVAVGTTSHAGSAVDRLQDLIDNRLDAAEAAEAAHALEVAVDISRVKQRPVKIFDKGLEQARRRAPTDTAGSLKILHVVEPLAPRDAGLLAVKQTLLEKTVAQQPDNLDAVSELAVVWEAQKEFAKCEQLLARHKDKLDSREGTRILGQIYAQQGKLDEALPLLQAYVDVRLDKLHADEQNLFNTIKAIDDQAFALLKSGKATDFDYQHHKAVGRDHQDAMVQQYINDKIKNSPEYLKAQDAIRSEGAVVVVALDLGLVLLKRGQAMADAEARKQELEKAEKTFLAVRGSAGKSDEFRLNLGQVYYWLGKQAEGRKLFDELLKERANDTKVISAIAIVLREVGAVSEARILLEDAYDKETDPRQRAGVARGRTAMYRDLDDRILWLERVGGTERLEKAELAAARGDKAIQDNRDADAIQQLTQSIGHFAALPETTATLNNCALVHFSLFRVNADSEEMNKGIAKMEKAVALEPRNSLLVGNAAGTIMGNALWEVIGTALDRKILRASSGWELFPFLYADTKGREVLVEKVRKLPAIGKAQAAGMPLRSTVPLPTTGAAPLAPANLLAPRFSKTFNNSANSPHATPLGCIDPGWHLVG